MVACFDVFAAGPALARLGALWQGSARFAGLFFG
jgi:hypothetical protein